MTNRAFMLAVLSCLPGAGLSGAAHAQDAAGGGVVNSGSVPANISVADRPRPEYDPIGGRLGSFFLYPRVEVSAQATDNLRASTTDKISDVTGVIRPSAILQSRWGRNELVAQGYFMQTLHAKTSPEDISSYGVGAQGRLDATRATTFRGNASIDKLAEPRTNINNLAFTRSPLRFTSVALGAGVTQSFVAFDILADAGIARQRFDDNELLDGTPFPLGFRDNTRYFGSLEARTRLGTGLTGIARVSTDRIAFSENPLDGIDRDSQSYRAEVGVGLAVSRLVFGDIRVGYFKSNSFDPRFIDATGLSFAANVLYSPTTLTSVRITADRSVDPGGSTVSSGNVRSTGAITVDHELLRNLVLTGYGRYSHITIQGLAGANLGSADEFEVRGGARYYANRRWRFDASLSHFGRRGDILPVDVNTATLSATLML